MAFFYVGCTVKGGRFMYLEDLFIEEFHRGKGAGSAAMKALASAALAMKCQRLVWQALDWNTPALGFYKKIGAKIQSGLLTSRYANRQLYDLAKLELALIEDDRTAN
jgi:RimJ/RimL family protein N-acetyltransferase